MIRRPLPAIAATMAFACGGVPVTTTTTEPVRAQQNHSSPLAVSPDHSRLYVVHPDADSVSALNLKDHSLIHETLLSTSPPKPNAEGRYEPAVGPRALALNATGSVLYVTGQRSGVLYAVDTASGAISGLVFVCAEPIGVLVSSDDQNVYVACSQDDEIVEVQADDLTVVATTTCPRKPWALAWANDGQALLVTHLLGPGVSRMATRPFALLSTWTLPDGPPQGDPEDPTEPHGVVRGIYDVGVRPGTSETWVAHMMLGIDTPQPTLDFQSTAFASVSILDAGGEQLTRMSVLANPGDGGAFGDIVSGPRAMTFSDDGRLAFVVDADSEDVLIIDADQRVETQIIRPLPGHLPEGVVWADGELYVQERGSEDIAAFLVARTSSGVTVEPDGAPFATLSADPMPANLRLGQRMFYSANSDDMPVTQNHWVACATCHLEGRSDAVTWLFAQGPRDTPTNAGGLLDTGFLFRTADRRQVQDYWRTINVEQGGHFNISEATQQPLLDALAAFVNYAIPAPVPPSTDLSHSIQGQALADLRARGEALFTSSGCPTCHSGSAKTDSGAGNPLLDLAGPIVSSPTNGGVVLHDVGTCTTSGPALDVAHEDIDGDARDACAFDTPALRGLWDSAPYLHDGSAATLADAVAVMLKVSTTSSGQPTQQLSDEDLQALVEYLRSL